MSKKYLYYFSEGNDAFGGDKVTMKNTLGGKGAGLAEMTAAGMPVPQGFTITTDACTQYYADGRQINDEITADIFEHVKGLEEITGKPAAAIELPEKNLYGFQFHPEVLHTPEGKTMLHNFVYNVCGCKGDWEMGSFVETSVKALREKIGDGKVLCALSGGVDSSVAAAMLSKAVGKQLTCVFVDHGLLRKNEMEEVCEVFGPNGQFELNFVCVNARQRFYDKLAGVSEPEKKRKIIGEEFIRVFEEEAKKIGIDFYCNLFNYHK